MVEEGVVVVVVSEDGIEYNLSNPSFLAGTVATPTPWETPFLTNNYANITPSQPCKESSGGVEHMETLL